MSHTLKLPQLCSVEKGAEDAKRNTKTCHQERQYDRGHQPHRPESGLSSPLRSGHDRKQRDLWIELLGPSSPKEQVAIDSDLADLKDRQLPIPARSAWLASTAELPHLAQRRPLW